MLACKGIPDEKKPLVTLHVLRHTAASLLVAAGVPIFDVARILGHKDMKTTMRYAHFAPEAGRAAAETLERLLDLDAQDEADAVHDGGVVFGIG